MTDTDDIAARTLAGSPDAVRRYPLWLTRFVPTAAWLHLAGGAVRPTGVLIAPSFGYEYTHAHRSLLHLADRLATRGFAVLRIDYAGTGDSAGDESASDYVDGWLRSLEEGLDSLEMLTGARPAVCGLALGALLAGDVAQRADVQHLVAWAPVVQGRRYLRERTLLARTGSAEAEDTSEAGGFKLGAESEAALKRLAMTGGAPRILGRALVVERDDLTSDPTLAEHFSAHEVPCDVVRAGGFAEMMAEPQYTRVPFEAIDSITSWLTDASGRPGSSLQAGELAGWLGPTVAEWSDGDATHREEHVLIPSAGGSLYGVLNAPSGARSVVLLSNSGSVHHVGPHRLYVQLARSLARDGVATLRLDLGNLGDSRISERDDENHPYPSTATTEILAAVDWLTASAGFERVVLAGLCSGAHAAFRAGLENDAGPGLAGVVCVNPLAFAWRPGMSLDTPSSAGTAWDAKHYSKSIRDRSKWIRLLKGRADLGYIVRFVLRRVAERGKHHLHRAAVSVRLRPPTQLESELRQYGDLGRAVHFVFADGDPGHAMLRSAAGSALRTLRRRGLLDVSVVPDADHTFSRDAWRIAAVAAVRARVQDVLGPSPTAPRQ